MRVLYDGLKGLAGGGVVRLLGELVREKGNRGAAAALGIDPGTVSSCMKTDV